MFGLPAAAFALIQPITKGPMSPLPVAAPAGGHFVLQPGRAAFDTGNDMLGGCGDESYFEIPATPNALPAIAVQDDLHSLTPVGAQHRDNTRGRLLGGLRCEYGRRRSLPSLQLSATSKKT